MEIDAVKIYKLPEKDTDEKESKVALVGTLKDPKQSYKALEDLRKKEGSLVIESATFKGFSTSEHWRQSKVAAI